MKCRAVCCDDACDGSACHEAASLAGWLRARHAEVAQGALDNADKLSEADRDFYTGKIAVARFFATTVLPRLETERKILEQTALDLMDVPEAAF